MTKKTKLGIWERIYKFEQIIRPNIPFTSFNTVRRSLEKGISSILDVGCGTGEPARALKGKKRIYTVGIDIFIPSLELAKQKNNHNDVILADVRYLPLKEKSFDVVTGMEILEHLNEEDGLHFIQDIERIARKQVMITTPVGKHEQDTIDGNLNQIHKHIWEPKELKKLRYKVRGHGIRNMGGLSGIQSPIPKIFRPFLDIVWIMVGPFVYYFPLLSGNMVCIKKIT